MQRCCKTIVTEFSMIFVMAHAGILFAQVASFFQVILFCFLFIIFSLEFYSAIFLNLFPAIQFPVFYPFPAIFRDCDKPSFYRTSIVWIYLDTLIWFFFAVADHMLEKLKVLWKEGLHLYLPHLFIYWVETGTVHMRPNMVLLGNSPAHRFNSCLRVGHELWGPSWLSVMSKRLGPQLVDCVQCRLTHGPTSNSWLSDYAEMIGPRILDHGWCFAFL